MFLAVIQVASSPSNRATDIVANPDLWVMILWPIILGLVPLFFYVLCKCIVDVEDIRETNHLRGAALFKRLWLAPDFLVLAIGLAISSNALNSVLLGKGLKSYYADDFDKFFWILIAIFFGCLLATLFLWLVTGSEAKTFPTELTTKDRLTEGGIFKSVEVYRIRLFKGVLGTRVGFWNIFIGNGLGIVSVLAYCLFIYYGFIRKF